MTSPRSPYYAAMERAKAVASTGPDKADMQRQVPADRVSIETSTGTVEMQASIVKVVTLPQVLAREPIAVARATNKPCRIIVKNLSGATVNLGFSAQDIQGPGGLGSDIWVLLPGDVDTLIAAPGQVLYGNASAPGAQVCASVSEAFPIL